MKSAYISKFYLKQPKYASSILLPQLMSSGGSTEGGRTVSGACRGAFPPASPRAQPVLGRGEGAGNTGCGFSQMPDCVDVFVGREHPLYRQVSPEPRYAAAA